MGSAVFYSKYSQNLWASQNIEDVWRSTYQTNTIYMHEVLSLIKILLSIRVIIGSSLPLSVLSDTHKVVCRPNWDARHGSPG
jgi:hypothetical protein